MVTQRMGPMGPPGPAGPAGAGAGAGADAGWRPVPDPTVLTTQQVDRAVSLLTLQFTTGLAAVRELIEARLDGNDKAIDLLQKSTDRIPAMMKEAILQLQALHEEKFGSIQKQFQERDTRSEQTGKDAKTAVDAALQAAKEAVGAQNVSSALAIAKSEAATTKQMDSIGVLVGTMADGLNGKIDDIKTRLTTIEGHAKGSGDMWGYVIGAIGLIFTIVSIVGGIIAITSRDAPAPAPIIIQPAEPGIVK